MVQFSRPSADGASSGGWLAVPASPGDRWDKLDDLGPDNVDTYAWKQGAVNGDYFDQRLSNIDCPAIDEDHFLRFQVAKLGGGKSVTATISLHVGNPSIGTLIASFGPVSVTPSWQTHTHILAPINIRKIGNYSDLWVRVSFAISGSGDAPDVACSWIELEAPDVGVREVIGWRAWYMSIDTDQNLRVFDSTSDNWEDLPDTGFLVLCIYETWEWKSNRPYRRLVNIKDWYCLNETTGNFVFVKTHLEGGSHQPKPPDSNLVCKRGDTVSDTEFESAQQAAMESEVL